MERVIGRPLRDDEDVHHKNHNPLDNAIDNLELIQRDAHSALHAREKQIYSDIKWCVVCGAEFRVNPRKRKRNKCCSSLCAMTMRITARRAAMAAIPAVHPDDDHDERTRHASAQESP